MSSLLPDRDYSHTAKSWLWLSAAIVLLDQLSKIWVIDRLELYERVNVLPFLDMVHVHNTGAAFSFLADAGGWQRWFFLSLSIGVSLVLIRWLWKLPAQQTLLAVAFALILGGAIGNAWDRGLYGYVIDFVDVYYQNYHWPAFNIADSAITGGAVLLIWDMLFGRNEMDQSI